MSILKVNSLQPANAGSEDYFLARAWCNFVGTNGSVNGSGNVSSVTDFGASRFQVSYASALSTANHSVTSNTSNTAYNYFFGSDVYLWSTTYCQVRTHDYNSLQDVSTVFVTAHAT